LIFPYEAAMPFEAIILALLPPLAVLLDLLLGDPARLPHPVRWLGAVINLLEKAVRRPGVPLRFAGAGCVLLVAGGAGVVVWLLSAIPLIGLLFALYLAYAGLGLGCLLAECRKVALHLKQGDVDAARTALSWLVSRDTTDMDEQAIRRALAETVSENLNDGFTAPFFYLMLFGPTGMWVYKAVSTMDSMWGYRSKEWRELGWAAARCDDILAWIPARLTALFMLLAGRFLGLETTGLWGRIGFDASRVESPNAGWPMAAAAWLLRASLGGPAVYFGVVKEKPVLGPQEGEWDDLLLEVLFRLILWSGVVCALILYVAGFGFRILW
jgi:adenosylcobinamide-phosphate synthase